MSDIDKRVVQMEFDNSKFDKNVKKSSNTLSKFEEQLKFKDVEYSLNAVKKGFSSFEIAAITAVSRITNAVITLGTKIVKSLSIDQISDGWKKFGDKTIAVATLAAQKIVIAGKELENYEDKLEGITDQLEKLEWFTNETSYTFNDMVAALGKFTAAGQDLDRSVNAMEGIATWAAMSGANAQKASSAMTQLAQTLGRGYVLRIDWQSIQTLNMDTAMFREKVLETATELGKLKKVGNDFISNTGKKITSVNFTETLASKWFTSDVLVKTLEKYSAAVEDIYKLSERDGISARAAIEKYGDTLDEFAVKAFRAAQETRTLGEALVYVFSTIGSTWSKTFEKIVGGYDEAKTLWSDLSDALYDDVIAANDFRNEILGVWSDLEGRSDLFAHGDSKQGAFWNIYDSIIAIKKIFKDAKEAVFPKSTFESEADQAQELGQRFKAFTESLRNTTAQTLKNIKNDTKFVNILKGMYTIIKILIATLAGVWNVVSPIVDVAKDLIDNVFSRLSILGNKLSKMDGIIETIANTSEQLRNIVIDILDVINPEGVLNSVIGFARDIFAIIKDVKPFETLKDLVTNFFTTLNESGGTAENFKRIIQGVTSIISMLAKVIKQVIILVNKYVVPVAVKITDLLGQILATVTGIITEALAVVADFFTALNSMLEGNQNGMKNFSETVIDFLKTIPSRLKVLGPILESTLDIVKSLIDILLLIPKLLDNVSKAITGRGIVENIKYLFDSIAKALRTFKSSIETNSIDEKDNFFKPILSIIQGLVSICQGILSIAKPLLTLVGQLMTVVGNIFKAIGEFLKDVVEGTWRDYKTITKVILGITAVAAIHLLAAKAIMWLVDSIHALINPLGYLGENVADGIFSVGRAMQINAFANVLYSLSLAFLSFTVALSTIGKMPKEELSQGVSVLLTFGILIGAFVLALAKLSQTLDKGKVLKKSKSFSFKKGFKSTSPSSPLEGIASVVMSISVAMLALGITIKKLGKLSPEQIKQGGDVITKFSLILFGLISSIILLNKSSKTGSKVNDKALSSLSKMIGSLSGMLLALTLSIRMIAKTARNPDEFKSATNAISIVMGSIAGILLITNLTAKSTKGAGPSMQALPNLIKSISLLLLSVTAALLIISSIKNSKSLLIASGIIVTILGVVAIIIGVYNKTTKNLEQNVKKDVSAKLGGTIFSMALLLLTIAGAIAIIASVAKENFEGAKLAMIGIALFITLLIGAMYVMSKIGDAKGVGAGLLAALTMVILLVTFATIAKQLSDIGTDAITNLAIIVGLIVASMLLLSVASMFADPVVLLAIAVAIIALSASMMIFGLGLQIVIDALTSLTEIDRSMVNQLALALLELEAAGLLAILVGPGILALGVGLLALAEAVKVLSTCMDKIVPVMEAVFTGIAKGFAALITTILTELPKILVAGLEALVNSFDRIIELLLELLVKINEHLDEALPVLVEITTKIVNAILQVLINTTPKLVEWLTQVIKGILKIIRDTTPDLIKTLKEVLLALLDFIAEMVPAIIERLFDMLMGILDVLISKTPDLIVKLTDFIGAVIHGILASMPRFFLEILDGIIDGLESCINNIEEYEDRFYEAGELLMEGLTEGLVRSAINPLKAIKSVGKGLWNGLKEALGIHSPSRLFAEAGDYLMLGLAKGIKDNADKPNDELEDASKNLTNTISQVSDHISDNLNSDDITIRPVLDLSNVDKGVNSIKSLMSGISGDSSLSVSGNIAAKTSRAMERRNSESVAGSGNQNVVNNEGDNYYSTFNIRTDNPEEFAKEADKILQKLRLRANLAKGGAR